jgi:hypothetical protein
MWFCTETGVNRFDGHHFETFTVQDGLADNENFKCYEDEAGRIWFCSFNGKLSYYLGSHFYNEKNNAALKYNSAGYYLVNIISTPDECVWFSTNNGEIYCYNGKSVEHIDQKSNITPFIYPVLFKKDNRLKFYQYNKVTDKIEAAIVANPHSIITRDIYVSPAYLKDGTTLPDLLPSQHCSYYTKSLGLMYISKEKLMYCKNDTLKVLISIYDLGIRDELISFYYKDNIFWLSTRNHGLLKIEQLFGNNRKITRLFKDYMISSIYNDKENNFWFTSFNNCLLFLSNNSFALKHIRPSLPQSFYPFYSVICMQNPLRIVTGTANGAIIVFDSNYNYKMFETNYFRPLNRVLTLQCIDNHTIYIGGDHMSFTMDINTGKALNFFTNSAEDYPGTAKRSDKSGNSIIYLSANYITRIRNGKSEKLLGFTRKYRSLAMVNDSVFYYGTTFGVYKYLSNKEKEISILPDSILKTMVSDISIAGTYLWIGTPGNGIFVLRNDKMVKHIITDNSGLVSNHCQKLFFDGKKYVWVATNKGVSVFYYNTGTLYRNITSQNGLISDDVKNIASFGNTTCLVSESGLCVFDLDNINFKSIPPRTFITKLNINDSDIPNPVNVSIKYFRRFITIYFTAITYEAPEDIQYQYRVSGNNTWITTKSQVLPLFDLLPGIHIVEIRAKKFDSNWSNPVKLTINIIPLFWQTWWFKSIIALVVAALVFIFIRARVKSFKKREKEKALIEKQISELEGKALANQMNPHFIFNSLNTLQQFILTKEEEAALNYLAEFASLMRQILNNSKKPLVNLEDEIVFINKYLKLEKTRFSDHFNYKININKSLEPEHISIPPMLLQPVLENAVKYGISPNQNGIIPSITINIGKNDKYITVEIEDFGPGINKSRFETSSTLPFKNSAALGVIKERLGFIRTMTGEPGTLNLIDKSELDKNDHGTIVTLLIPIQEQPRNDKRDYSR